MKFYPLALAGSLRRPATTLVNVISAEALVMDDTAAAKWFLAGLPVVLAESLDDAKDLARVAGLRYAEKLASEWEAMGIEVPVVCEAEVEQPREVHSQLGLFEEAA